ncbi:MAG: FIST C-terminal domain-containing protein [Nitrospiraceae bacterium]|nr:FIST C-terminal domain-containing protein [Nitrospiraceae bacterium]
MMLTSLRLTSSANEIPASLTELDSPKTLVVLFGPSSLLDNPAVMQRLLAACPTSATIGCSTAGEIQGSEITDDTLVLAALRFDHTSLKTAYAAVSTPADSYAAGVSIAKALHQPSLKGLFVLSDGLSVNGSDLVKGLNDVLKGDVIITGGLAGDGPRFKRTWVIKDRTLQSGYVTAIGFYGDRVRIGHGSKGGWDKFGPERLVTRSEGNVLYELDNRPALQLYKEYLGDRSAGLPATALLFPLALRASNADAKVLVRTILAVDEAKQSMTFAGDIPQGSLAQLMRANFDRLIQGASEAASLTVNGHAGGQSPNPTLSIAISCVGRRLVLGERTEEETEATLELLPKQSAQVGFYSYGEISPYASGVCDLHNQTMTLTTITEI